MFSTTTVGISSFSDKKSCKVGIETKLCTSSVKTPDTFGYYELRK